VQWTSLRSVALVAAAVLGAYAVTMLFRSTVFTLGAMVALLVGATVLGVVLTPPWLPHTNLLAILQDGARYFREVDPACFERRTPPEGLDCRQFGTVSLVDGVRYWILPLTLAVLLSVWSFRRRDVP
jgi:ABC-2 type transport system permease protein